MSLGNFGDGGSVEEKYGELACTEAERIDELGITDGTASTYKPQIRQIISTLGYANPEPDKVIDIVSEADKGSSTKNTMIMAMKKYYQALDEFGKSEELGEKSKRADLSSDNYDSGSKIDEWVTIEETMRIIDELCPPQGEEWHEVSAAGNIYRFTIEHKALVATLYYTGLRVSEVLMLKPEDFDFNNKEVKVYRLKKGGEVVERDLIKQTDKYLDIVKEYISTFDIGSDQPLFDFSVRTAENRVDDIEDAYCFMYGGFEECENLTPHKFRHARVTSIANKASLEEASEYVGHESSQTTKAYRHMTTSEQEDILPESDESENEEGGSNDVKTLLDELGVNSVEELKEQLD